MAPKYYNGVCQADIGALYKPSDGKTRVYVRIGDNFDVPMVLAFRKTTSAQGAIIDWGDGNVESVSIAADSANNSMYNKGHVYAKSGEYIIKIDTSAVLGGSTTTTASDGTVTTNRYGIAGSTMYSSLSNARIYRVDMGVVGNVSPLALYSLSHLEVVNCGEWKPASYSFYGCHKLKHITDTSPHYNYKYYACRSLVSIAAQYDSGNASAYCFYFCEKLRRYIPTGPILLSQSQLAMLQGAASLEDFAPASCNAQTSISVDGGAVSLETYRAFFFVSSYKFFPYTVSTSTLGPKRAYFSSTGVTAAGNTSTLTMTLRYASRLELVDCSGMEFVPTIVSNFFPSQVVEGFTIVVPDALYDSFASATNWSSYKSYMVKASEYKG